MIIKKYPDRAGNSADSDRVYFNPENHLDVVKIERNGGGWRLAGPCADESGCSSLDYLNHYVPVGDVDEFKNMLNGALEILSEQEGDVSTETAI